MKGVVRIQALVRGRQVRKQAAVTLRCMQALVRVQARVRARRVRMSMEGQAVQDMLNERRSMADLLKEAEVQIASCVTFLIGISSTCLFNLKSFFNSHSEKSIW